MAQRFCWRLGVVPQGLEQDRVLIAAAEALMLKGGVGIDDFFFAWMGDASPACPAALVGEPGEALWADFGAVKAGYAPARDRSHRHVAARLVARRRCVEGVGARAIARVTGDVGQHQGRT